MVWSDPEIKKLSQEFVTVADEVYMLYPEDPGNLNRVKDRPDHQFFKKYGESMPPGAWNHPGTKQGIYMIGPNAEYLEGRFAAASEAGDIRARLQRALARWEQLKSEKGYRNAPIPARKFSPPPGVSGELILRVNLRDLPRRPGDQSGARIGDLTGNKNAFLDYVRWAWNENWIGFPDAAPFVPKSTSAEPMPVDLLREIATEVLVDNVRGQAPTWSPQDIRAASGTQRRTHESQDAVKIAYSGRVSLSGGGRGYDASFYGESIWNPNRQAFESFDIVFAGMRTGASRFNRREDDLGPAPMGVTLSLHR